MGGGGAAVVPMLVGSPMLRRRWRGSVRRDGGGAPVGLVVTICCSRSLSAFRDTISFCRHTARHSSVTHGTPSTGHDTDEGNNII